MPKTQAPFFFAHANGFPGASYSPLFDALKPGELQFTDSISENPEEIRPRLWPLAARLEREIEQRFDSPIIGVGHSLGAILTFLVAKKRPELFEHIILMDPPFFRPWKRFLVAHIRKVGLGNLVPVAAKAAKRRNRFSSPEEAKAYFAEKRLFRDCHPDTIDQYVEHGLVKKGEGWELRIPPEFERAVYLNLPFRLDYQELIVPSSFLYSGQYDVLSKADVAWLKSSFSKTRFFEIEGSHMFPMEQPEAVGKLIKTLT
ncbi:MAG: alpha/beta hydrolase [Bacteroidia bacterium]